MTIEYSNISGKNMELKQVVSVNGQTSASTATIGNGNTDPIGFAQRSMGKCVNEVC